jgi:sugar phosphate isomerase/epimerase
MAEVELMALYWTVSGPADVHVGREWSLFDWRDRCREAAGVGYAGIGLWHADIEHQLETRSFREMKEIFDESGLANMEDPVDEVVNHRHLPGEGQFPIREYVAVAQEMGYDKPWGVEVLSEELRSLPIEEEFKRSYEATIAQFGAPVA